MNNKVGHNYRCSRYFENNTKEYTNLFNGLDLFWIYVDTEFHFFLKLPLQRYSDKYSI